MRYLFWLVVCGVCLYFGYDYFFGAKVVPPVAAVTATVAATSAAASTAAVAATSAAAGAVAATGFWAMLWAGGWFLGEMTFLLWAVLGCFILVPLGIIAWLTELPEEEGLTSGGRIAASLSLFGVMLALLMWGGVPFGETVREHWAIGLSGLVAFVVIGVWWSLFKYDLFAARCKEDITKLIEGFCRMHGLKFEDVAREVDGKLKLTLDQKYERHWRDHFGDSQSGRVRSSGATHNSPVILFRRNKERISLWVLFWPASMLRGLLEDILAEALDALIRSLRRVYESIATRHAVEVVYTSKSADPGNP